MLRPHHAVTTRLLVARAVASADVTARAVPRGHVVQIRYAADTAADDAAAFSLDHGV